MNPGYLLSLYGQVRAGSFVLALLPWTLTISCNPWARTFRWPGDRR